MMSCKDLLKTKHGMFHSLSSDLYIGNSLKIICIEYHQKQIVNYYEIYQKTYVFDNPILERLQPFLKKV